MTSDHAAVFPQMRFSNHGFLRSEDALLRLSRVKSACWRVNSGKFSHAVGELLIGQAVDPGRECLQQMG
jgi:hypothetical protein